MQIHGLKGEKGALLNDKYGTVMSFDKKQGKFQVRNGTTEKGTWSGTMRHSSVGTLRHSTVFAVQNCILLCRGNGNGNSTYRCVAD